MHLTLWISTKRKGLKVESRPRAPYSTSASAPSTSIFINAGGVSRPSSTSLSAPGHTYRRALELFVNFSGDAIAWRSTSIEVRAGTQAPVNVPAKAEGLLSVQIRERAALDTDASGQGGVCLQMPSQPANVMRVGVQRR